MTLPPLTERRKKGTPLVTAPLRRKAQSSHHLAAGPTRSLSSLPGMQRHRALPAALQPPGKVTPRASADTRC